MLNHIIESSSGFLETPNGKIYVKTLGKPSKTPMIALHGGPGFPHDYLEPLEALSNQRQIIFYDQLGCGRSDRPSDLSLWTIDRYVEELELVRKNLDIDSFHLFGSSWGTMLGMDYYLKYPNRVTSILFQSPCLSAPMWSKDAERLCAQMGEAWNTIVKTCEANGTTQSPEYSKAMDEYALKFICRKTPMPLPLQRSRLGFGRDPYMTMWGPSEFTALGNLKNYDQTSNLHKINVPTLFTCGRHDEATPESVAHYASLVKGSQFVIFENSAHGAHLEETDKFLDVYQKFLDA